MTTIEPAQYVVATIKAWNLVRFREVTPHLPGTWHLIDSPAQLTAEALAAIGPRYVFFPHWSWKVPAAITDNFECVCFHMTDVPYGRGGSPLQNLIVRGHTKTVVSALRMETSMDTGSVYLKRPLGLDGSAHQIFERASDIVFQMIKEMVTSVCEPVPQVGNPVTFPRRTPTESVLPTDADASRVYDHIRMLDADGYPHAFIDHGGLRLELTEARLDGDEVLAKVRIARRPTQ